MTVSFQKARTVVLSLDWVVASGDQGDRRRLAYLVDTLRHIREAIETHAR